MGTGHAVDAFRGATPRHLVHSGDGRSEREVSKGRERRGRDRLPRRHRPPMDRVSARAPLPVHLRSRLPRHEPQRHARDGNGARRRCMGRRTRRTRIRSVPCLVDAPVLATSRGPADPPVRGHVLHRKVLPHAGRNRNLLRHGNDPLHGPHGTLHKTDHGTTIRAQDVDRNQLKAAGSDLLLDLFQRKTLGLRNREIDGYQTGNPQCRKEGVRAGFSQAPLHQRQAQCHQKIGPEIGQGGHRDGRSADAVGEHLAHQKPSDGSETDLVASHVHQQGDHADDSHPRRIVHGTGRVALGAGQHEQGHHHPADAGQQQRTTSHFVHREHRHHGHEQLERSDDHRGPGGLRRGAESGLLQDLRRVVKDAGLSGDLLPYHELPAHEQHLSIPPPEQVQDGIQRQLARGQGAFFHQQQLVFHLRLWNPTTELQQRHFGFVPSPPPHQQPPGRRRQAVHEQPQHPRWQDGHAINPPPSSFHVRKHSRDHEPGQDPAHDERFLERHQRSSGLGGRRFCDVGGRGVCHQSLSHAIGHPGGRQSAQGSALGGEYGSQREGGGREQQFLPPSDFISFGQGQHGAQDTSRQGSTHQPSFLSIGELWSPEGGGGGRGLQGHQRTRGGSDVVSEQCTTYGRSQERFGGGQHVQFVRGSVHVRLLGRFRPFDVVAGTHAHARRRHPADVRRACRSHVRSLQAGSHA
eukprot:scaffold574_cov333-Pavlova_lutheri.AAC.32